MIQRWVTQTRFHGHPLGGNCTEAAVASLLGLRLEAVGDLGRGGNAHDHWTAFEAFFRSRGFEVVRSDSGEVQGGGRRWARQYEGLYLASGPTERFEGTVGHMVVMRDGELVHDPHPDGTGLTEVRHTYIAIPLDPAKHHG